MKKTIAGYFKTTMVDVHFPDGTLSHTEKRQEWVEQEDVELGPLEESAILADWAIGDHQRERPEPLQDSHKLDMLMRGENAELSRQASDYDKRMLAWEERHKQLHDVCKAKYDEFDAQLAKLPKGTKTC